MVQGGVETEVKIRLSDLPGTLDQLRSAGFKTFAERIFESNTLYDHPDQSLRTAGMLLRLRQAGNQGVITWKGVARSGPHKSRPELETTVGSVTTLEQILRNLGFESTFRYEKYRTEYSNGSGSDGVVTVDETPIGNFLELEGTGEWIDKTAKELGFSSDAYILDSYGALYLRYCQEHGLSPDNMVFPA